jgi:hypothetical protein
LFQSYSITSVSYNCQAVYYGRLFLELSQYHFIKLFLSILIVKCKDVPVLTSASGHHEASWISSIQPTTFSNSWWAPLFLVHTRWACGSSSYLQEHTVNVTNFNFFSLLRSVWTNLESQSLPTWSLAGPTAVWTRQWSKRSLTHPGTESQLSSQQPSHYTYWTNLPPKNFLWQQLILFL